MQTQAPRPARSPTGGFEAVALFDPESGQPIVFASGITGTPAASSNAILFDVDLTGVQTLLAQLTGTWGGSVAFEASIDGAVWFSIAGYRADTAGAAAVTSTSANLVVAFPAIAKRIRARLASYSSGTVNSALFLTDVPAVSVLNLQALPAGTNVIGGVTVATKTTGGTSAARIQTASGSIKTSAGQLYAYDLMNTTAALRFLQIYAKTSAGIPGTDTPVRTIPFAAGQVKTWENTSGSAVTSGLAFAITTDAAGATLAAAGDIVGTIDFA
ncbi:hypothetical protein DMC25_27075 [Caulobacter sp. D4A]|uniref:hypothetical protein n=1 Tax=unclassified Caulobacter TaxID=2648921 RepID=UPI000D73AC16|nr:MULTISPECIES: hypothetical protein [unclassified Caulobacter]PXA70414.1 hypothetical protein DMC25_27075 [Caulobacter sp. D4A]PXA96813.1 hypothetical protein DMC18_00690 [Caulobacter sp. D5]